MSNWKFTFGDGHSFTTNDQGSYANIPANDLSSLASLGYLQNFNSGIHVDWFSPAAFAGFTASNIGSIDPVWFSNWLNADQISHISPSAFAALRADQLQAIPASVISQVINKTSSLNAVLNADYTFLTSSQQDALARALPITINANGVTTQINPQSAAVTLNGANDHVTLNGTGETAYLNGRNGSVTLNGTGETAYLAGTRDLFAVNNQVIIDAYHTYTLTGSAANIYLGVGGFKIDVSGLKAGAIYEPYLNSNVITGNTDHHIMIYAMASFAPAPGTISTKNINTGGTTPQLIVASH